MRDQMADLMRDDQSLLGDRPDLRRADGTALFVEESSCALESGVVGLQKRQFEIVLLDRTRDQIIRVLRIGTLAHELEMELSGELANGLERLHDESELEKIALLLG